MTARKLEALPKVSAAFAEGDLSRAHVERITDTCGPERIELIAGVDAELADASRIAKPRELAAIVARLTEAIDGDGGAATGAARDEGRHLHVTAGYDHMVHVEGQGDILDGEFVATATKHYMDREFQARDSRTTAQRRWDALVGMCRLYLDVGRLQRTATPAQWRALVARDGHCQAPGCDRGSDHCQAHHIVPWPRGGPTALGNLILLCNTHHRQVHLDPTLARRIKPP